VCVRGPDDCMPVPVDCLQYQHDRTTTACSRGRRTVRSCAVVRSAFSETVATPAVYHLQCNLSREEGPVNRAGIWKNALRCLTCIYMQAHCFESLLVFDKHM